MKIGVDARSLSVSLTGIGRYTYELCKALAEHGHEIVLYSPNKLLVDKFNHPLIQVKTSTIKNRTLGLIWFQFFLHKKLKKDSLDVFWGTAHKLPFFLPSSIIKLVTIHDLVWAYAGTTMRTLNKTTESLLMPYAINHADWIITVSDSTGDALISKYPYVSKKVSTVYPGATQLPPPLGFDFLLKLHIHTSYCLFVGTQEPRKNLYGLISAFAKIIQMNDIYVQLVLVGTSGWGNNNIKKHIQNLDIEKYVIITGYVTDTELSTLYHHARFLAMPSFYEGFGFPIIEAMSAGVPVLTSNNSSMPEVVGNAGIIVDPNNHEAIVAGMMDLFCNDSIHKKLKKNTLANANRFNWKTSANYVHRLLNKLSH